MSWSTVTKPTHSQYTYVGRAPVALTSLRVEVSWSHMQNENYRILKQFGYGGVSEVSLLVKFF